MSKISYVTSAFCPYVLFLSDPSDISDNSDISEFKAKIFVPAPNFSEAFTKPRRGEVVTQPLARESVARPSLGNTQEKNG